MINEHQVKKFCCEDISLIENYEQALNDKTQTWHCHHRKETDDGLSVGELKAMGLYYNRPACELIFLTPAEHTILHNMHREYQLGKTAWNKGKPTPDETKAKISETLKGRQFTAEHKEKIGAANKGKHRTTEQKAKIGERRKGITAGKKHPGARAVYQIDRNSGAIIKKWDYIKEAAKALNIKTPANISACCKGKYKHACGYVWKYADELDKIPEFSN